MHSLNSVRRTYVYNGIRKFAPHLLALHEDHTINIPEPVAISRL